MAHFNDKVTALLKPDKRMPTLPKKNATYPVKLCQLSLIMTA